MALSTFSIFMPENLSISFLKSGPESVVRMIKMKNIANIVPGVTCVKNNISVCPLVAKITSLPIGLTTFLNIC